MKLLVVSAMLLGMLGCSNCKRQSFIDSVVANENMHVWGGGVKASGEVGVKYKDGIQFVRDGSFNWYSNSGSAKKETQQATKMMDTTTVADTTTTTTTKPILTNSYRQDTVYKYAYRGPPTSYGYGSRPYEYPNYGHEQFSPYGYDYDRRPPYGYQPRKEPSTSDNMRFIPL